MQSVRGGTSAATAALIAIVLVVVGAVIVLTRMRSNSMWADVYSHAVMADLRALAETQQAYFAATGVYTAAPNDSFPVPGDSVWHAGFTSSENVTVRVVSATATGWSATAHHARLNESCGVFVGDAPSPIAGASEGVPRCGPAR